ncbi:MAG: SMC family ATPase [Chloroflexota bacterium]|nr:SMC family ATPase [Chloroflexota bacterium]
MILAALEIDNYKQFHGRHRVEPPAQGIVGVIGANGAGKTTLFEAIEWCLYNPREIVNDEVPPRGGVGATRVKVTLEDPRDGVRYVVERGLKKGAATAEVYREDQPEAPIVQGSRQTAEYVASRLIGLGHRAFVSTFFTRQKELTFFGNMRDTERRREVGRLLGLETIRDAQRAIGEERAQARADAESLKRQHAESTEGRDFAAEVEAAEREVTERSQEAEVAEGRVAAAGEALLRARGDLERWRDLERRDAEFARVLERLDGDARVAEARRASAGEELSRLEELDRSRLALVPVAGKEPDLAAAVAAYAVERERFARQRQLRADLERADAASTEVARRLGRAVTDAAAASLDGWRWSAADGSDPIRGAARLGAVIEALDVDGACERAVALARCELLVQERDQAGQKLHRYTEALRGLEGERVALVRDGDPAQLAERTRQEREAALQRAQAAATSAQGAAESRKKLEPIVAALEREQFDGRCPTCFRTFTPDMAETTVAAFADSIDSLRAQEEALLREERALRQEAAAHERSQREALERAAKVEKLSGRLQEGARHVDEARQGYEHAVCACREAIAGYGLPGEPTAEQVRSAQAWADLLQRVAATLPLIRRLEEDARQAAERSEAAQRGLEELGEVAYDEAAHRADEAALIEARDALARLAEIDRQLARCPAVEAERAAAEADLTRISAERDARTRERGAIGFDPAALTAAAEAEGVAMAEERDALDGRTAARAALTEAMSRRTRLAEEHARIAKLVERADARARVADALDRMYREFTRFDQYVAERVTPQLAEHTGELLAAVTEGKYDRVEFDENYGLEIYDGADEKFPMDDFSGGERDVAALCARLALSRMVGGQAAHPPGFLVLDEVFGSLDRERRAQVLETLGSLTASTEAFHQLFIISHVDDVRASPIFNQIWRVTETAEGVSQLQDVTLMSGADEL